MPRPPPSARAMLAPSAIATVRRRKPDRGLAGSMSILRLSMWCCAVLLFWGFVAQGLFRNTRLGGAAIAVDRDVYVIHMVGGR